MDDSPNDEQIRLLLVEDDRESGPVVEGVLTLRGLSVCLVASGEEALDVLAQEPFDIVVSDVRLGSGMSGVRLLRAVREDYGDLPVILITGFDSLNSAIEAVRLGAQDYILKPFDDIEQLLLPVEKAVHTHRLERQNRLLQRELRESEARFRNVLDNAVDVIFQIDVQSEAFEYVSPSSQQVLGMSPQEVQSLGLAGVLETVSAEDRELLKDLGKEGSGTLEIRFRSRAHGLRWLSISASLVCDEAGHSICIVGTARDVTDVRRMKEHEREYRLALGRAERMESLAVLAGGVAHDLNNILMPILTLPGVILDDIEAANAPVPETLAEDLDVIGRSGQRAAAVARDLLSLSRCQFVERTPLPINEIVESVLASGVVQTLVKDYGSVRVEREMSAREPMVNGSETHLYQALLNLVINALEAMPQGGVLRVRTEIYRVDEAVSAYELIDRGEYVRLTVTDTGHGIPADAIDRVFEPFHSRKQRSTRSGSGLGLAVVYGVVKGHEGYVDLASAVDEGTSFSLYFPACHQAQAVPEAQAEVVGGSERVLLVDDEDLPREMAVRMLRQLGYRVTMARSGHEAVDILRQTYDGHESSPFALVLLDMVMEDGFDGLDTFCALTELCPTQRCMLISGFSDGDRVRRAQKLGAGGFLQKPFSVSQLARKVRAEIDAVS